MSKRASSLILALIVLACSGCGRIEVGKLVGGVATARDPGPPVALGEIVASMPDDLRDFWAGRGNPKNSRIIQTEQLNEWLTSHLIDRRVSVPTRILIGTLERTGSRQYELQVGFEAGEIPLGSDAKLTIFLKPFSPSDIFRWPGLTAEEAAAYEKLDAVSRGPHRFFQQPEMPYVTVLGTVRRWKYDGNLLTLYLDDAGWQNRTIEENKTPKDPMPAASTGQYGLVDPPPNWRAKGVGSR